ncbi:MAG TPA: septum site-determining protein MinC [Candidatus Cybelea sp.]
MTLLRGRRDGLEVSLSERDFEQACDELEARLAEQPSFYRGSSAVVNFGDACPSDAVLARLRGLLEGAGISLRALSGSAAGLEDLARERGLDYEASAASAPPSPPPSGPADRQLGLSDAARTLVADFAGARGDIAQRRRRGEGSVPRLRTESRSKPPALHVVEAAPGTLYHPGTLRGGQVLHHTGNIVVVGDVNPGAELVATGDIVVFGRLRGIAHAGAGGDETARIYALDLTATQLRIATFIAAEQENTPRRAAVPEAALARDGGIVVLPLDRLGETKSAGAAPA